jgi:glutamate racemase
MLISSFVTLGSSPYRRRAKMVRTIELIRDACSLLRTPCSARHRRDAISLDARRAITVRSSCMAPALSPVGFFDSGVGGLAVLAEAHLLLPGEDLIYYADTAFFPYGSRPAPEIRARAEAVTRILIDRGAKAIVVACNTATSAAILHLRETFEVPFVGMEPALKPAAEQTLAGKVALLVTPGTAHGQKLAALIDRYGAEVTVRTVPAPDLAERVEAGALDDADTRALVRRYVAQVRESGADVLALGCTHYAFLRRLIEEEAGDGIAVIEPSDAVARQLRRVLDARSLRNPRPSGGCVLYLTSGSESAFAEARARLHVAGAAVPEGVSEAARAAGEGWTPSAT